MFRLKIHPSIEKAERSFIEKRYEDTFEVIFKENSKKEKRTSKETRQIITNKIDVRGFENAVPSTSLNVRHAWEDIEKTEDTQQSPDELKTKDSPAADEVAQVHAKSTVCIII